MKSKLNTSCILPTPEVNTINFQLGSSIRSTNRANVSELKTKYSAIPLKHSPKIVPIFPTASFYYF